MDIPDLTLYSIGDLRLIIEEARTELEHKTVIASASDRIDAILTEVKGAQGFKRGDLWRQPQGAHDAYPAGAQVFHKGRTWDSTTTANVWEPGVSGWKEYAAPGTVKPWKSPTGAHDVYNVGDIVMHEGKRWRSTAVANVWAPGVYGWEVVL